MAWTKAPDALVALFAESVPRSDEVVTRKMFGYPAAFVNGNMFAGLFQDQLFARLPSDEQADLERQYGPLPFEPMLGRPMKGYVRMPPEILAAGEALATLLAKAHAYTASLPPKEKKAKRVKTPR